MAVANGFFTAPTVANQPEGVTNRLLTIPWPLTMNQQTYRGDQTLGKFGSVFGRFTYSKYVNTQTTIPVRRFSDSSHTLKRKKPLRFRTPSASGSKNVNNFRFGYLSADAPQGTRLLRPLRWFPRLACRVYLPRSGLCSQSWPNVSATGRYSTGGPGKPTAARIIPNGSMRIRSPRFRTHTIGLGVDYRHWYLTRNLDDDFYGDLGFRLRTSSQLNTRSRLRIRPPLSPRPCHHRGATASCGTGNAVADMMTRLLQRRETDLSPAR